MSNKIVRNSLLKSSLSIKGIQSSVTKFNEGITKSRVLAGKIAEQTSNSNRFKQSLIGKDVEFFRKRREGVLRKQREDELESMTVGGVLKKQGNLIQKSTRGFLGRILDFIGVLLLGWLINTLPAIIKAVNALIKKMRQLVNILTGFVDGIRDVLSSIGGAIDGFLNRFKREDYDKPKQEIDKNLTKAEQGYAQLNENLINATLPFQDYSNIGLTDKDLEEPQDEVENLKKEESGEQKDDTPQGSEEQIDDTQQESDEQETDDSEQTGGGENVEGQKTTDSENLEIASVSFGGGEQQVDELTKDDVEADNDISKELTANLSKLQPKKLQEITKQELPRNADELAQNIENESGDAVKSSQQQEGDKTAETEGFSTGGKVEGKGGIDNVLAKLTSGEFILTKETTERIGANFFEKLNKGAKIEQLIKPNPEMISDIQGKLIDKSAQISQLTTERKGSTIMMMGGGSSSMLPPSSPPSSGNTISMPLISPSQALGQIHHILHRYT